MSAQDLLIRVEESYGLISKKIVHYANPTLEAIQRNLTILIPRTSRFVEVFVNGREAGFTREGGRIFLQLRIGPLETGEIVVRYITPGAMIFSAILLAILALFLIAVIGGRIGASKRG